MKIFIKGHTFGYELQRVVQLFFPGEKVEVTPVENEPPAARSYLEAVREAGELSVHAVLCEQDMVRREKAVRKNVSHDVDEQALEHMMGALVWEALSELTGLAPPWGVLTGIRPVKLFMNAIQSGMDEEALREHFIIRRKVAPEKFALAMRTAQVQAPILAQSAVKDCSLYISIPFCPTRCAYCSFVSHSVAQAAKLIPEYLNRLCEELAVIAADIDSLGLRLRTVYFGGGTPTSLTAEQLGRIMQCIKQEFQMSGVQEYTVEAGRPDTITQDKLDVLKMHGAGRISINPQTFSDEVLRAIGRNHTAADTVQAYEMARNTGFDCINMDLIAGLPLDSLAGFQSSVKQALALRPENITLHTLTVKRAARLTFSQAQEELAQIREMTDSADLQIQEAGYVPYYLYRQNGSLGGLENVGYALPGHENAYNIFIMDERHTVFGAGAGSTTKICLADGSLHRFYNYKYPYEYISRFATIRERRRQAADLVQNEM